MLSARKIPACIERALGDHALPFLEQVGQQAGIGHRHFGLAVGDGERDALAVAMDHAARLDQPADAQPQAGANLLFGHFGGAIEEHDIVANGEQTMPTATPSTAERRTISASRFCLRVICVQPQFLRQRGEFLLRGRIVRQRLARLVIRPLRLVLLIQHFIGANKAQPFVGSAALRGKAACASRATMARMVSCCWSAGLRGGGRRAGAGAAPSLLGPRSRPRFQWAPPRIRRGVEHCEPLRTASCLGRDPSGSSGISAVHIALARLAFSPCCAGARPR